MTPLRRDRRGVASLGILIVAAAVVLAGVAAIVITSPRGGCVADGSVLDGGGTPVRGAQVYLLKLPGISTDRDWRHYIVDESTSGSDGSYRVSADCTGGGRWSLTVRAEGFDPVTRSLAWNAGPPVSTSVTFRLDR